MRNKSINENANKNYENTNTNFKNYHILSKNTTDLKKQAEIINHNSNSDHTSCLHTQQNKKNGNLNMSFLNNFNRKNITPDLTPRKNHLLDESYEKKNNISNFSFQLSNNTVRPTNNYNLSYNSKTNNNCLYNNIPQGRNRTATETKENLSQIDENYLKSALLNSTGKVLNIELINKILNDLPEFFSKKSAISTKEDTLKLFNSNNYQSKTLDFDTIEYLHFMFVKFFQKSKQIMITQEKKSILMQKTIPSDKSVIRVDEIDIE